LKRLVIDLDHTVCVPQPVDASADPVRHYADAEPVAAVIAQLKAYKAMGFEIAIHTARNMRTFAGDIDAIRAETLPLIADWLDRHGVPYDEIIVGKPWCGAEGFYVDDRAIRPSELVGLSYADVIALLDRERRCLAKPTS
jgi:capsule biosynthesis phosphatase